MVHGPRHLSSIDADGFGWITWERSNLHTELEALRWAMKNMLQHYARTLGQIVKT